MKTYFLNIKWSFLLFLFIGMASSSLQAQSFEQLFDYSGDESYLDHKAALVTAADSLVAAFPQEYQDKFKVYDFGFYLHQEDYDGGGYPYEFERVVREEIDSPYYLAFGRQTDGSGVNSKTFVDIVLPNQGDFSCLDLISENLRDDIIAKYDVQINDLVSSGNNIYGSEIRVLEAFTKQITEIVECCDPERSQSSCGPCLFTAEEILINQKNLDFFFQFVLVEDDPEYDDGPTIQGDADARTSSDINAIVKNNSTAGSFSIDGETTSYNQILQQDHQNRLGINTTIEVFKYKYPRDCGSFSTKWDAYESSEADLKIFLSFVNYDDEYGVIGVHATNQGTPLDGSRSDEDAIRLDEIEHLDEAKANSQDACNNLVLQWMVKTGVEGNMSISGPILNPEVRDLHDRIKKAADEAYLEANKKFKVYWDKEYNAIYHQQSDSWMIWAFPGMYTTYNLCNNVFHTLLEICEVVPIAGSICAVANTTLYLAEGKYLEAGIAAIGVIPLAGTVVKGTKWTGKLWKAIDATGCISGRSNVNYCRMVKVSIDAVTGVVSWGNRSKLRKLFIQSIDNGANVWDGFEAHHLIPWSLRNREWMKVIAKTGWHINIPANNGMMLPKYILNGLDDIVTFHANHPEYTQVVDQAMERLFAAGKISENLSVSANRAIFDTITGRLRAQIDIAESAGISLNNHFLDVFEMVDEILLDLI